MRKTVKAISSLLLTMLLVMGSAVTAFAADATITYTGKDHLFDFAQGSEYTETDLFNNFKNVMPGDVLTQKITVTNKASDCDYINLYMRARVHDEENNPLSTAVAANGENVTSMSDFLGQLTMRIYNGKTLFAPIKKNEHIADAVYYVEDREIAIIPLYAVDDVNAPKVEKRFFDFLKF